MTKKYGVIDTDDFDEQSYEAGKMLVEEQELNEPVTAEKVGFVLSTIKKEAPYDEQSIKQLYLGMLSAFTKVFIHHAVSSKSAGAGDGIGASAINPKAKMIGKHPISELENSKGRFLSKLATRRRYLWWNIGFFRRFPVQ